MCRIAGIIDFFNPQQCQRITHMRDSMLHGGPDDAGNFFDETYPVALGVRRLSLLDLSMLGHQPMQNDTATHVIAFNGELYNFAEIKQELQSLGHHFKSGTDTEVVLHAYMQWGKQCFAKFNGMFALAIWNKTTNSIILTRDHAGMKPLYYFLNKHKKQLYFASEIRAFKTLDANWPEDDHWRIHFLAYGHMPEPHTTLQQVQSLPKGQCMEIQLPDFDTQISTWFSLPVFDNKISGDAATHALRETLSKSVDRHLVADAPLGIFLSGGIDSSVIALLAAKRPQQSLTTLSIHFDDDTFSEKKYQDIIANQIHATHHSFNITQKHFEEQLPDILQALDQPSNDGINSYFICQYAKQAGLKAVLSGIGGDELFGGYPSFSRQKWIKPLQWLGPVLGLSNYLKQDWVKRFSYLRYPSEESKYLFNRGYFSIEQIAALSGFDTKQVKQVLQINKKAPASKETAMQFVSRMEQDFYLQNQLLRDTDVMSMWHSVEVRMPFLDKEMLTLCQQTEDATRFDQTMPKHWLVHSFKDILPVEIWKRKKMGFVFPLELWMQKVTIRGACQPTLFRFEKQFQQGTMKWSRYWAYILSTRQPVQLVAASKRILFASLRTFSAMGGIEKFNRAFAMALQENAIQCNWQVTHISAYDTAADPRYFSSAGFIGFGKKRFRFMAHFLRNQHWYDTHILGHINLSLLVITSSFLSGVKKRRILITHGIEVWHPLKRLQAKALHSCSEIWSVSNYTAEKIKEIHHQAVPDMHIFPNTLDPFFHLTSAQSNVSKQDETAQLKPGFLLTISRLASTEQYKGYDQVIKALPQLLPQFPDLMYVLGGSGDEQERKRLEQLISKLGLQKHVILAGFIPEAALPAYYENAAAFVMPSRKEGFGIVFVEAAWSGIRVIAGNADGSPEALLHGKLGMLIDPGSSSELSAALLSVLSQPPLTAAQKETQRLLVEKHFGFATYKERQRKLLVQHSTPFTANNHH